MLNANETKIGPETFGSRGLNRMLCRGTPRLSQLWMYAIWRAFSTSPRTRRERPGHPVIPSTKITSRIDWRVP